MPLAHLDDLRSVLICPSCSASIEAASWQCSNARCTYNHRGFETVADQPVLVDFEMSIVRPDALQNGRNPASVRTALRRWASNLMAGALGPNRVAERNTRRIRQLMHTYGGKRLLIIGGATVGSGADSLYRDVGLQVVSFDIVPSEWTQFVADAHAIPLANGSVDGVWVQAVLEHVLDPQRVVNEIERVLRPNGIVYADTPFMQQVHMGPYDFTRFTENGHRWLFRNFECIDSGVVLGPGAQLAWSIDYAVRALTRSSKAGTLCHIAALPLAFLVDRCASGQQAIDGACAVYFLGRKGTTRIMPREMLAYYKGAQRTAAAEY